MDRNFRSMGPVEVSVEAYTAYAAEDYWPNFDRMYYEWLDENNDDEVRRLMLRDMLRQSYESNADNESVCRKSNDGFGRMFVAGGSGKGSSSLYWALRNRPKLLREMCEEALYNLENDLVPMKSVGEGDSVKLIELLMSVTDEEGARKFWKYHPANQEETKPFRRASYLFELWNPQRNMPKWLQAELWGRIVADMQGEIAVGRETMERSGIVNSAPVGDKNIPVIRAMMEFVYNQSFASDLRFLAIEPCLRLFETELPDGVTYASLGDVMRIATRLNDEKLALRYVRRHVIKATWGEMNMFRSRESKTFLYWLRGLTVTHTPGDIELLQVISSVFLTISEPK